MNCVPNWVLAGKADARKTCWNGKYSSCHNSHGVKRDWDPWILAPILFPALVTGLEKRSLPGRSRFAPLAGSDSPLELLGGFSSSARKCQKWHSFHSYGETQTGSPNRQRENCFKENKCHLSFCHREWGRSMLCSSCTDGLQEPNGGQKNNQELDPNHPLSFKST